MNSLHAALHERLPMWVVYDSPSDYPGYWVARLHLSLPQPQATDCVLTALTLDTLHWLLPAGLTRLPRQPDDDPAIFEVWL